MQAPDYYLRLTTTPDGGEYHDLAIKNLWASGQERFDLAEVTPVKKEDQLEQGDVVVIDEENGLRVKEVQNPMILRCTGLYRVTSRRRW